VDTEFSRCRGTQLEKSWKFHGMRGSTVKPPKKENPRSGIKPSMGGITIWIFS